MIGKIRKGQISLLENVEKIHVANKFFSMNEQSRLSYNLFQSPWCSALLAIQTGLIGVHILPVLWSNRPNPGFHSYPTMSF